MFAALILYFLFPSPRFCISANPDYSQPEQVHLSYAGDPSQMWVTWVTFTATPDPPIVEYSSGGKFLGLRANGTSTAFNIGEKSVKRIMYTHRVLLKNLVPGEIYMYHVGTSKAWSSIFNFKALKEPSGGYRFGVFGDLGNKNAITLPSLQQEAQRAHFDMMLHVGDLAYDLQELNGARGDQFMRQIEPIAAYVPYMVAVGNHEWYRNFSHYVNRFTMPMFEMGANNFYSFDIGLAHFIAISTEFYYDGFAKEVENQYLWLENDLRKAQKNRKNVPWIITMGHRPMYCVSNDGDDCLKNNSTTRTGGKFKQYGLENIFYKYGVDLEIWAHEHNYQRQWPVFNNTVYNGTKGPYIDPKAPVHVITGAAGNREGVDSFIKDKPAWHAFESSDYSYSRMLVSNATDLYFEQYSKGKVIDSFWLHKTTHDGPDSSAKNF